MSSILEILRERGRARITGAQRGRPPLRSGMVIRADGPRYLVNDGVNAVLCDSLIGERLRAGDRVYLGEGAGITLILGLQGRDMNFTSG